MKKPEKKLCYDWIEITDYMPELERYIRKLMNYFDAGQHSFIEVYGRSLSEDDPQDAADLKLLLDEFGGEKRKFVLLIWW